MKAMKSELDAALNIVKGIGISLVVYAIFSYILGVMISPAFEDKIPSKSKVEQCRIDSTAHVPREDWNAAYLTGIYKFCENSLTVPAVNRALKVSFISVALIFLGLVLKQIIPELTGVGRKNTDDAEAIEEPNYLGSKPKYTPTKFSTEEVDVLLTIVQNNKNKTLRYNAFVGNPMFVERNFTKKFFLENIEKIVRDYIPYDNDFTKNNRDIAIYEIQHCLEKGIWSDRKFY